MQKLQRFSATAILSILLAGSALAGDVHTVRGSAYSLTEVVYSFLQALGIV